jgi:hypothetical protein
MDGESKKKEKKYELETSLSTAAVIKLGTGDAAFTPATPHDLQHSRANTDSHNSHNTQNTRV